MDWAYSVLTEARGRPPDRDSSPAPLAIATNSVTSGPSEGYQDVEMLDPIACGRLVIEGELPDAVSRSNAGWTHFADGRQPFIPPVSSIAHGNWPNSPIVFQPPYCGTKSLSRDQTLERRRGSSQPTTSQASSPAASVATKHSSTSNTDTKSARGYSAGSGARDTLFKELPRLYRLSLPKSPEIDHTPVPARVAFPLLLNDEDNPGRLQVSGVTYDNLCHLFRRLCLSETFLFAKYSSSTFIQQNLLDRCVTEYFEHFHAFFPLIHEISFLKGQDSTLTLAVAAIGSFFLDCEESTELSAAFLEFLRRTLIVRVEALRSNFDKPSCLHFVQASLLSILGMYHHHKDSMQSEAVKGIRSLAEFCRERELCMHDDPGGSGLDHLENWAGWIEKEELRRTVYCFWLFGEMLDTQQQTVIGLDLVEIQLELPSSDQLFMTTSVEEWSQLVKGTRPNPTLLECLKNLTSDRHLFSGLTQLGHTLLVYGLFYQSRQMKKHLQHLARSCNHGSTEALEIAPEKHFSFHDLLDLSSWVSWRNQMCDCLDVLHRHANGVTGHAGGFQEPLVLHLHLARVILLSPCSEIQSVARFLSCGKPEQHRQYGKDNMTDVQYTKLLTALRVWLSHDKYKMRLAVIHAAGIFWHIRRYSVQSFHEPAALFLAALTIWSFCLRTKFLCLLPTDPHLQPEGSHLMPHISPGDDAENIEHEASSDISRVYIDRVLDDELVQTLVLGRGPVEMYMSRIGDLNMAEAPVKVLNEAARLMELRCSIWPISKFYYERLLILADPLRQLP